MRAPAKINLTLDVGLPRPEAGGYHPIRSVMQTVALHDTLTVERTPQAPGIVLAVVGPEAAGVPADASNIVHKAAVRLQKIAAAQNLIPGDRSGLHLILHKRIPSQAGLGGGSSDAAATLLAVSDLFGLALSPARLTQIGAELGADVPFFLTGGLALAEGLGERVTQLHGRGTHPGSPLEGTHPGSPLEGTHPETGGGSETPSPLGEGLRRGFLVIVKPPVGVSTQAAYAALDALPGRIPGQATEAWLRRPFGTLGNDFENAILPAYSEVSAVYEALRDAPEADPTFAPLLCGSGACVFRFARSQAAAEAWAARLNAEGRGKAWATETAAEAEPGV